MNNLVNFQFGQNVVRIRDVNGEPWFVVADVCQILGIGNPTDAVRRLDHDEYTLVSIEGIRSGENVNAVNEYGLYALILSSRKPEAKAFKRWITHEVLPSIRKTGSYGGSDELVRLRDENAVLRLKTQILEEHTESDPLDYDEVASMLSEYMQPPFGPKHFRQWLARHGIQTTANHKDDQPNRKYINRGWFTAKVHKWYKGGRLHTKAKYFITWLGFSRMIDLAIRERLLLLPPETTPQMLPFGS